MAAIDLKGVQVLSREDGMKMFDELARETLHMSGQDFIEAWDAGKFRGTDIPDVIDLAMLLPFVR